MRLWVAVIVVGIASYSLRSLPVLLFPRAELADSTQRTLRNAATAVLCALIASMLVNFESRAGVGDFGFALAAVMTTVVVARVRSPGLAVAVGLATYAAASILATNI